MARKRAKKGFATPFKSTKTEDDFDSLGKTPVAPTNSSPPKKKSRQAKAPVPDVVIKTEPATHSDTEFTPAPTAGPSGLATPATDFTKLGETPVIGNKLLSATPASEGQRNFESLGVTPVVSDQPATGDVVGTIEKGQAAAATDLSDEVAGPSTGGRSKRRRTQTQFFGEVTSSEAVIEKGRDVKKEEDDGDGDSDFNPEEGGGSEAESEKPSYSGGKGKMPVRVVSVPRRASRPTGRRGMTKSYKEVFEITQLLATIPREPHEVPFHPAFLKHRGWDTDGVSAWVMPHPLAIRTDGYNYSENEVKLSEYFTPGPPVCPFMVRLACNGRYPENKMSVRIALQMRRSHIILTAERENRFIRLWEQRGRWAAALLTGHLPSNFLDTAVRMILRLSRSGPWNITRYVKCVHSLALVQALATREPLLRPLVNWLIEGVKEQVEAYLNSKRWSPLFREQFNCLGIKYTGVGVGKRVMSVEPGSGPPFLTDEEFRRKFGEYPVSYSDEELTRIYDDQGNVTGHFEVPPLRELLTPIAKDLEEREEERRARHPTPEDGGRAAALAKLARLMALEQVAAARNLNVDSEAHRAEE